MKIIGLKQEEYMDKKVSKGSYFAKAVNAKFIRYIIYAIDDNNDKYKIKLWTKEGTQGFAIAKWGYCVVERIDNWVRYNYVPIDDLERPDLIIGKNDEVTNKCFTVSINGGSDYHPCGYMSINMSLFKKVNRDVWVLIGDNDLIQLFIDNCIGNKSIYKVTNTIKDKILEDIIILENKLLLEDIKIKLFESDNPKIHIIQFPFDIDKIKSVNHISKEELENDVEIDDIFK